MSRTQRIVVPITLLLILLAAVVGVSLGTVPAREWDIFFSRFQGKRIVSIAPVSNFQSTLYMLDTDQPTVQRAKVNLWLAEQGSNANSSPVSIWLTAEKGAVEMPLDNGLALRMELVSSIYYPGGDLESFPTFPVQVAGR